MDHKLPQSGAAVFKDWAVQTIMESQMSTGILPVVIWPRAQAHGDIPCVDLAHASIIADLFSIWKLFH